MRGDDHVGPGFSRAGDDVASGFSRTDAVVDAAAQALTSGEPSAQLRMAVRARIERNHSPWPIWGRAAVACAAALLLIVAALTLSDPRGEPDRTRPAPVEQTAAAPRVAPAVADGSPSPRVAQGTPPRRRPTRALESIDPLVIEPIVMPLIAVTSSGVMPIEIDDLQIEPLQVQ